MTFGVISNDVKKKLTKVFWICITSICLGFLFPSFVKDDLLSSLFNAIAIHFELPFANVKDLSFALYKVICFSCSDIVCIFIIFVFAFSALNSLAINAVLAYNCAKFGFDISVILRCYKYYGGIPNKTAILVFSVYYIFSILIFAVYSHYSFFFKNKQLFPRFIISLVAASMIFLLNLIYCLSIYLI